MRIDGRTNVGALKAPPRDVTALPHRQTFPSRLFIPRHAPPLPRGRFVKELSRVTYLDLHPCRRPDDRASQTAKSAKIALDMKYKE